MRRWTDVMRWAIAAAVLAAGLGVLHLASAQDPPTNAVEELQRRLDDGSASLAYAEDGHGYLTALLKSFGVPASSQLLVFSRSSLQFDRIDQHKPRALYYKDDVSLGTVQDGKFIEVIASDKAGGVAFYTLDAGRTDKPRFTRRTGECIICHGFVSRWAPGLMVANSDTGPGGSLLNLDIKNLFRLTDHRSRFEDRYGGWYVTGNTGAMHHRGNITLDPASPIEIPAGGLNIASLGDRIDLKRYLEPGSDIVSLLTLEHQAGFVGLVTRINAQYRGLDNRNVVPALRATREDIDASIAELVSYMVFADEVPLPSPVKGSSDFTRIFAAENPHDGKGRSLREFDLRTRLFRYPLSYMLYSQAFDNLNPDARLRVLRGVYDALSKPSEQFAALKDRQTIAAINIAAATKPGLPDFWKALPEK